jgi:AcrR family transcriptional regulator
MAGREQRGERRADALSKERIVGAAIDILDTEGEAALTFRALTTRLATGSGAIYWHVANKDELLVAATDAVVSSAMAGVAGEPDGRAAVRAAALAVFDAIDTHPWVGAQLSREPWQPAIVQIFEAVGGPLAGLGVPEHARFDAATALVSYALGLAAQYAAGARLLARDTGREAFLETVAGRWRELDPERYPFVHEVAGQLSGHDDREQFLAGVDLFLAGIAASHPQ